MQLWLTFGAWLAAIGLTVYSLLRLLSVWSRPKRPKLGSQAAASFTPDNEGGPRDYAPDGSGFLTKNRDNIRSGKLDVGAATATSYVGSVEEVRQEISVCQHGPLPGDRQQRRGLPLLMKSSL